jgi:hypothetical protein
MSANSKAFVVKAAKNFFSQHNNKIGVLKILNAGGPSPKPDQI